MIIILNFYKNFVIILIENKIKILRKKEVMYNDKKRIF